MLPVVVTALLAVALIASYAAPTRKEHYPVALAGCGLTLLSIVAGLVIAFVRLLQAFEAVAHVALGLVTHVRRGRSVLRRGSGSVASLMLEPPLSRVDTNPPRLGRVTRRMSGQYRDLTCRSAKARDITVF